MAKISFFLVDVISIAVEIYIWLIIARVIISFFQPRFQSRSYHPVVRFIYEVTEPFLALCRRFLPQTGVLDFSPLVAIIILELGKWLLVALINRVF